MECFSVWMGNAAVMPDASYRGVASGRKYVHLSESFARVRSPFPRVSGVSTSGMQGRTDTSGWESGSRAVNRTPKGQFREGPLLFEEAADSVEDFGVHGGGDAAGLRVLLAWMVDAKQTRSSGRDFGFGPVREFEARARSNRTALFENVEVGVPGDFAQRKDRFRFQDFQLAFQIAAAIQDFSRERLVFWGSAAAGCGDVGVDELQAVVAVKGSGLICEACFVQGSVKEIAGAITGEHAAGAIRAVCGGRESQNQQLRLGINKTGNGFAPILPFAIGTALFTRNFFAVFDEARAFPARDNFFVQDPKFGESFPHAPSGTFPENSARVARKVAAGLPHSK